MYLSIGEAATFLGISISTLRRWDLSNSLSPCFRTKGGHRRYLLSVLQKLVGIVPDNLNSRRVIGYARVSSHDQKDDLKRQIGRLDKYCKSIAKNYEIINDLGSGLNYVYFR